VSTVRQHQLDVEERDALCDVVGTLVRVAGIRRAQLREAHRELKLSEDSQRASEGACERLCEELGKLLGHEINRYDYAVDAALLEIRRLRHDLGRHQEAMKQAGVQLPEEMPF
jgi:hypothetical protein